MNDFSKSIGNTILRLRKEKKLTQEQLSNMLGVSSGAVSKWENGNSTPDISLLPPLARALNTSLDTLLSFQKELSDSEVVVISQKLNEAFIHKGFDDGEKRCNEYLKEYPNSTHLKFVIASSIFMYIMMINTKDEIVINDKLKYSLELLYQVVDSKETRYVSSALFAIANIHMMLENYDESEKALKELSNSFLDPMVLYTSLLQKQGKNNEAEDLCKKMLMQYLNQSTAMLSTLSYISKKEHDYEKTELYLHALNEIQSMFKIGMYSGAYSYFKYYLEQGEKDLAAKWFKIYVDGLIATGYDYSDNMYFKDLKLKIDVNGQKVIRKKLLQSIIDENKLEELQGILDYEVAIQILKDEILNNNMLL